jgi:pimeloyl-ACP methyl ester carboxylesterase
MPEQPERLFLPGWGARGRLYRPGLPAGWTALQSPRFGRSAGSFDTHLRWIVSELDRRSRAVELGGHSMGGALAIAAAAARPDRVSRLVLISPAGLPLSKPLAKSLVQFVRDAGNGRYPLDELVASLALTLRAPRAAYRLACDVHDADLSAEMAAVRAAGIPATVIACVSDSLVTVAHCRSIAELIGARYRELALAGGHTWMLDAWPRFARELAIA